MIEENNDKPFGDRNPDRVFDPEQSNGEDAPANKGEDIDGDEIRRKNITSPETEGDRDFEVEREFGREIK